MKRQFLHWMSALLACVAMVSTSCDNKSEEQDPVTPVFPDAQSVSIPTGETRCNVSFTPNLDWTISIPTDAETAKWFWLLDGEIRVSTISGKASAEPVSITVATTDQVEFDATPVCEVSLTMGGQTKVIASVSRSTNARSLEIYQAEYDSYGEIFNYGTYLSTPLVKNSEETPAEMLWSNNGLEYVFKVTSNFGWSLDNPNEWLTKAREVEVEGDANSKELRFDVVFTEGILDGATAAVDFYDTSVGKEEDPGNNAHNRYYFKVPAVRDVIRHSFSGLNATYNFTAEGKYSGNTAGMEVEMKSVTASLASAAGIKFYVLEQTASGYKPYAGENTDALGWLTISDTWDATGEAFQTHQYTITASANTGSVAGEQTEARTAQLLALPKSLADAVAAAATLEEGLLANNDLKAEYKPYLFATAQQAGSAGEGSTGGETFVITPNISVESFITAGDATFEHITTEQYFHDHMDDEYLINYYEQFMSGIPVYILSYNNNKPDGGNMFFDIKGTYGQAIIPAADVWLSTLSMPDEFNPGVTMMMIDMSQGTNGSKSNITFTSANGSETYAILLCYRKY